MGAADDRSQEHRFLARPHRTLVGLALPVLLSLVAEPITGLVDTAFVARLGAAPLAALGVGAMALSSVFWIFNFLGVGTQTEVAQAAGRRATGRAAELAGMAVAVAAGCGLVVGAAGWWAARPAVGLLGAEGEVAELGLAYVRVRLLGAPAVLVTVAAFGALRGLQEMRVPLVVATGVNLVNIALDGPLVFGWGPAPALGVAGAAWASVAAQWLGALWAAAAVARRLGVPRRLVAADAGRLVEIGADLFVRTGALTAFLLLATRAATRAGAEAGAAHQAIRQVWQLAAYFLDAFAVAGQSLVAFFVGGGRMGAARRVAAVVCWWSFGTGVALGVLMVVSTPLVARLFVPEAATGLFVTAWWLAAAGQPLGGLAFGTDGVHWGTGDYRYLRNAVVVATAAGALGLWLLDESSPRALDAIWAITAGWIAVRAGLGFVRIWPGFGRRSPWREPPGSRESAG